MVGLSPVNDCLRLCNPVVRYHGIADFLDTNELAECDYDYKLRLRTSLSHFQDIYSGFIK